MAKKRRSRPAGQKQHPWEPLVRGFPNPVLTAIRKEAGVPEPDGVYSNETYQVIETNFESGMSHLSIKRNDRHVIRDWRHLQSIKNEICGADRWAVEIFPSEDMLVDSANEYHLWVLPAGEQLPFGFHEQLVSSDAQVDMFNAERERGEHKGRQRPFQPGLPMAVDRNEQEGANESLSSVHNVTQPMKGAA